MPILDQAVEAARAFKPMSKAEVSELRARTAKAVSTGKYEFFKTDVLYDATAKNPLRPG